MTQRPLRLLALLGAALAVSCSSAPPNPTGVSAPQGEAGAPLPPGLPHFRRWSERIAQGGAPEGEAGFKSLQDLGFKTVLTVDGMAPDVETARRHGLRYVHVPIGYDGATRTEEVEIVKAVKEAEGPVYIHCHHGLHRGPAAAAFARIEVDGVSNAEAERGLRGTCSPDYPGLFASVRKFRPPTKEELAEVPQELPSRVLPQHLKKMMVHVSDRFGNLKKCAAAGWKTPESHPDVDPFHETTMLWENFREGGRLSQAKEKGSEFLDLMGDAEAASKSLKDALAAKDPDAADKAFKLVARRCDSCHAHYRN